MTDQAANDIPPPVLTQADVTRLVELRNLADEFHDLLRGIEREAYQITREEDKTGFTTDYVYCGQGTVEELLVWLGIEVA